MYIRAHREGKRERHYVRMFSNKNKSNLTETLSKYHSLANCVSVNLINMVKANC